MKGHSKSPVSGMRGRGRAKEDRNMARKGNTAWMAALGAVAALGAILMFIAAQPRAAVDKPAAAQKPVAQRPADPSPVAERPVAQQPAAQKSTAKPNTSVTVSGCLETEGRAFKLTEVKGPQAPKGRSWKTGFIKKTTKDNVEVVSASSSVKLIDHVGRQVTVVGMTAGGSQIRATSIKRTAAACS